MSATAISAGARRWRQQSIGAHTPRRGAFRKRRLRVAPDCGSRGARTEARHGRGDDERNWEGEHVDAVQPRRPDESFARAKQVQEPGRQQQRRRRVRDVERSRLVGAVVAQQDCAGARHTGEVWRGGSACFGFAEGHLAPVHKAPRLCRAARGRERLTDGDVEDGDDAAVVDREHDRHQDEVAHQV
eukprot:3767355-Prymnesium_polylepis.1